MEPSEKPIENDGFLPDIEEHLPDSGTGDFEDKGVEEEEGVGEQGRGYNPPETEDRGQDTSQLSGGNGNKISGKLAIKRFTALKSLMEEVSGWSAAEFKVRGNHKEALGSLVRDVEFLMPSLTGTISEIEKHLSSKEG